jgi:uncharacterized membrane protein (UPF0127 family)
MNNKINLILALVLVGLIVFVAAQPTLNCAPKRMNKNLPTVKMQIGNREFTLEVAADERTREVGLMNRKSMPEDHGMIFVFYDEHVMNFWMRETLIPLDIIYINRNGKVVCIDQMEPLDERTPHGSKEPALYAIELNKGMAARAGLKEGDVLKIPELP